MNLKKVKLAKMYFNTFFKKDDMRKKYTNKKRKEMEQ